MLIKHKTCADVAEIDFKEICDNSYDAIYISNSEGKTVYVNDAYTKITGIEKNEVIGQYVSSGEGKLFTGSVTNEIIRTKNTVTSLGKSLRNGKNLLVTGRPIFDENKNIKFVVVNNRDISKLKFYADQFSHSNRKMAVVLNELIYTTNVFTFLDIKDYESDYMDSIVTLINAIAPTNLSVFITGEIGTGKTVLANIIYQQSVKNNSPFFNIQCNHYSKEQLDELLFGKEDSNNPGIFYLSNGGSVVLENIDSLSIDSQEKVYKILSTQMLDKTDIKVRVIAISSKNLEEKVNENTFSKNLFNQLKLLCVNLKPLREIRDDIILIAKILLKKYNSKYEKNIHFTQDAIEYMHRYDWPGNIWELNNLIERLVVSKKENVITHEDIVILLNYSDVDSQAFMIKIPADKSLKDISNYVEKLVIERKIEECGSVNKAAKNLKITQPALWNKCKKLNIKM